ncbi:hypothetical protein MB02_10590 [Croceicoccus estronivorus]|nr:hypothetical protein MB02_10590 [Croceicoccus estronivorus]
MPNTTIAGRPGIAFVCLWAGVLNATATAPLSPALPAIANELGGGADGSFVAQMIQTISAIGMIVGAAFAGYVSEWLGRRLVILAGAVIFLVAGCAGLVLTDLNLLIASRALTGVASGAMLATSYAVVGEHFIGDARNRILGFCGGAGAFAALVLLNISGVMVDALGWRSVFALYLLGIVIIPFAFFSMYKGTVPKTDDAPLGWMPILRLWPLWLLQIGFAIGVYMSVIQVPFIAAAKGISNASMIGLLVATTSVSAMCVALLYGTIRRFLDVKGMFVLISMAFAAGLLICAKSNGLLPFFIGTVVLGFGAGSLEPTIISRALHEIPERLHDRAAGTAISTLFLGQFLNPIVVYPLVAADGVAFATTVFGLIYAAVGALFLLAIGMGRRRTLNARLA